MPGRSSSSFFFNPSFILLFIFSLFIHLSFSNLRPFKCTFEDLPEPLPEQLNTYSYLTTTNEFHLHGEFYVNFTEQTKTILFNLTEESLVRLYVAPQKLWDIDTLITDSEGTIIASSSQLVFTQEDIVTVLAPGTYAIKLNFFFGSLDSDSCDTFLFEVAMSPTERVKERMQDVLCTGETLPDLSNLVVDPDDGLTYRADGFNVDTKQTPEIGTLPQIRSIKNWDIDIPGEPSNLWRVEAYVGSDFLTGGSLGVLLPGDVDDCEISDSIDEECVFGFRDLTNRNIFRWVLSGGQTFKLGLYDIFNYNPTNTNNNIFSRGDFGTCIPFSFELRVIPLAAKEDLLNCPATRIPTTLNTPNLLGDRGFMYYVEEVFMDFGQAPHSIDFTLTKKSGFAVLVPGGEVDIDITVREGTAVVATSVGYKVDERIVLELDPGDYVLEISYFGKYDAKFCQTFPLEIEIAPVSLFPDTCYDREEAPDLSILDTGVAVNVPFSVFTIRGEKILPNAELIRQDFHLSSPTRIRVVVGIDLLLSDMLLSIADDAGEAVYAEHRRGVLHLITVLSAGSYTLVLKNAKVQNTLPELPSFPDCFSYTFEATTWIDEDEVVCLQHPSLVFSLGSALVVGIGEVHIEGSYYVPLTDAFEYQRVGFTTTYDALLRVYTDGTSGVDVDFHLSEDDEDVAGSISMGDSEEEIVYLLKKDRQYELMVYFYGDVTTCLSYEAELSIVRADETPSYSPYCPDQTTTLPQLPGFSGTMQSVSGGYYFYGNRDNSVFQGFQEFQIEEQSLARFRLNYDFLSSNIELRLWTGSKDDLGQVVDRGVTGYNENQIRTVELAPGTYTLEIYEATNATIGEQQDCLPFGFLGVFGKAELSPEDVSNDYAYIGCVDYPLFDSISVSYGLSDSSGQIFHEERNILLDLANLKDTTNFTIKETSVIRVFVASYDLVDIDVYLKKINDDNSLSNIDQSIGYTDEGISHILEAGDYLLEFMYYKLHGQNYPAVADCASYPLELSIYPLEYFTSLTPYTNTQCIDSELPTSFTTLRRKQLQYKHVEDYDASISIEIQTQTKFTFDLRYEFTTSALALQLVGQIAEGAEIVTKSYFGNYGYNHGFLNEILQPGSYELHMFDPSKKGGPEGLPCAYTEISASLEPIDGSFCDNTESLPYDLWSATGGSQSYGGPQDSDGRIRFFGSKFMVPKTSKSYKITFKVPVDSYLRIFSQVSSVTDMDFYIYSDETEDIDSLVGWSNGMANIESVLLSLTAQEELFLLKIDFFRVADIECETFEFELAMKPKAVAQDEVLCPEMLPFSIRTSFSLGVEPVTYSIESIFSAAVVAGHTSFSKFSFPITLEVTLATVINVDIGYDFLVNDFRLSIVTADTQALVVAGIASGDQAENTYVNFHNTITNALLEPGTYQLLIQQDFQNSDFVLPEEACLRYSFSLTGTSSSNPTVTTVMPPSQSNMDPLVGIFVAIGFSHDVTYPEESEMEDFVLEHQSAYLTNTMHGIVLPDFVLLDDSLRLITLYFAPPFYYEATYQLMFDFSDFLSGDVGFEMAQQSGFFYEMAGVDCNGHGTWNSNITSDVVCICDFPYAGPSCSQCETGYHGVGMECVQNIPCEEDSCNGHGDCTSYEGYPECTCYEGYASAGTEFCSICATDYDGYPDCTRIPDIFSGTDRCKEPLLPNSLTNIQFLEWDGTAQLRGKYLIDPSRRHHDITFHIDQDSVLRFYMPASWVDVDVTLYLTDGETKTSIINGGLGISVEETIFAKIKANEQSEDYILRLNFYLFSSSVPTCETINIDLQIEPETRTAANYGTMVKDCKSSDKLPSLQNTFDISEDFTHETENLYIHEHSYEEWENSKQRDFIWSVNFSVEDPPEGKAIILHTEVGYQFLLGDFALALEPGTGASQCKTAKCLYGFNIYNKNVLATQLAKGNYTLWLYIPYGSYSDCALFSFSFKIRFLEDDEGTFACTGARLPFSLNAPNYLDGRGQLHFQDEFTIDVIQDTSFSLEYESYFKIALKSPPALDPLMEIWDYGSADLAPIASSSNGEDLLLHLPAGDYFFLLFAFDNFLGLPCPDLNLELAILPVNDLPSGIPLCDSAGNQDHLPSLPQDLGATLPYNFLAPGDDNHEFTGYMTFKTGTVVEYPITLADSARLRTRVASDFLTQDITLELRSLDTDLVYTSTGSFNLNILDVILAAGSYNLAIIRNSQDVMPLEFVPCGPFDFWLNLDPIDNTAFCTSERMPDTFTTTRFLKSTGLINYQGQFDIPEERFTSHNIDIHVAETSLFRVYTEPHYVDIDLKLYRQTYTTAGAEEVASADNGWYGEEVIVFELLPTEQYYLEVRFWKWNVDDIPDCPSFNMEFAITPIVLLPQDTCPNGATHWPPAPGEDIPSVPYYYDSTLPVTGSDVGELLYIQPTFTESANKTYQLELNDLTDLFVEVGYDFATSDLVLKLSSGSKEYYGVNDLNRNYLDLLDLLPGNYELTIYKPAEQTATVACAYFTFRMTAVAGGHSSLLTPTNVPFPTSFNTISYGYPTRTFHLRNTYTLFSDVTTEAELSAPIDVKAGDVLKITSDSSTDVQISLLKSTSTLASADNELTYYADKTASLTVKMKAVDVEEGSNSEITSNIGMQLSPYAKSSFEQIADKYKTKCAPWKSNVPEVFPVNSSFISLHYHLTKTMSETTLGAIDLTLPEPSLIFAKVSFPFIVGDISIILTPLVSTLGTPTQILSYPERDSAVLNEMLEAGAYVLTVTSDALQSNWEDDASVTATCFPYVFSFASMPVTNSSSGIIMDCTMYNQIPTDLNSATGGSQQFGGPLKSGYLRMYGENFLLNSETGFSSSKLTVDSDSQLSIFFYSDEWVNIEIQVLSEGKVITPQHLNSSFYYAFVKYSISGSVEIQYLYPQVKRELNDDLTAKRDQLDKRSTCPHAKIEIIVERNTAVLEDLKECSSQEVLPSSNVLVEGIYSEHLETVISGASLYQNGYFAHKVQLNLTETVNFGASLAFNPLYNFFSLTMRINDWMTLTTDMYTMNTYRLSMLHKFENSLTPGVYNIEIGQYDVPFFSTSENVDDLCFPIYWDLYALPIDTPYISNVLPIVGEELNPALDLEISVTFSSDIFVNNVQVTHDTSSLLAGALYLTDDEGDIYPSKVSLQSSTVNRFSLTFEAKDLREGGDYQLSIVTGQLTDSDGNDVVLPSTYTYKMIPKACHGHGTYSDGKCTCTTVGYTGDSCNECDSGYVDVSEDSTALCQPEGTGCLINSCGCANPEESTDKCIPLGTCSVVSDKIHCECNSFYSGSTCQNCATGYVGWPSCRPQYSCTAQCNLDHGYCDVEHDNCVCELNWNGDSSCSSCTDGWTGSNCDEKDESGMSKFLTFLKVSGILLICFIFLAGLSWAGWIIYKRQRFFRRNSDFYPLGLEELEGGYELDPIDSPNNSPNDEPSHGSFFVQQDTKKSPASTKQDDSFNPRTENNSKDKNKKTTPTNSFDLLNDDFESDEDLSDLLEDFNPRDTTKDENSPVDDALFNL